MGAGGISRILTRSHRVLPCRSFPPGHRVVMERMSDALDLFLHQKFHLSTFRPGQKEIITSVLGGFDTLAVMPTGGGKSLCFQLPALFRSGITLVISPLIALMRDQVQALQKMGVPAGCLHSGQPLSAKKRVFSDLRAPLEFWQARMF